MRTHLWPHCRSSLQTPGKRVTRCTICDSKHMQGPFSSNIFVVTSSWRTLPKQSTNLLAIEENSLMSPVIWYQKFRHNTGQASLTSTDMSDIELWVDTRSRCYNLNQRTMTMLEAFYYLKRSHWRFESAARALHTSECSELCRTAINKYDRYRLAYLADAVHKQALKPSRRVQVR